MARCGAYYSGKTQIKRLTPCERRRKHIIRVYSDCNKYTHDKCMKVLGELVYRYIEDGCMGELK